MTPELYRPRPVEIGLWDGTDPRSVELASWIGAGWSVDDQGVGHIWDEQVRMLFEVPVGSYVEQVAPGVFRPLSASELSARYVLDGG